MINFDDAAGVYASEVEEVREQVRAVFIEAFKTNGGGIINTDPSTPQGQLIDSITALIVQKDNDILYLANMFNPLKSQGIWQDALGKLYYLERHKAIASKAVIKCTGKAGVFVPTGAQLLSTFDNSKWSCIKGDSIKANGFVELEFCCNQTGPIAAPPNSLTKIITTVAGWDTANNENAAIVGQDEESAAAFENRRYKSVAYNSRSSIQSAYSKIAALDGVIAVCMRQNRTDQNTYIDGVEIKAHSVYTCVLGGNDNEIANALYSSISAGCAYTGSTEIEIKDKITKAKDKIRFSRPHERAICVEIDIRKSDLLPPNAEELIKSIIYNNFYGTKQAQIYSATPITRVVMGDDLYSSRFYAPLIAQGINTVMRIRLKWHGSEALKESLSIPIDTCPTLSLDDIAITWKPEIIANEGDSFGFKGDNPNITGFEQAPFFHGQSAASEVKE